MHDRMCFRSEADPRVCGGTRGRPVTSRHITKRNEIVTTGPLSPTIAELASCLIHSLDTATDRTVQIVSLDCPTPLIAVLAARAVPMVRDR